MQCEGNTKKGHRCKNKTKNDSVFDHRSQSYRILCRFHTHASLEPDLGQSIPKRTAPMRLTWSEPESTFFILNSPDIKGSSLIAAYDFDWTIAASKSGGKFPVGKDDWKWLFQCVPVELKKLHDDGYKIVFFTNQGGVEKGKVDIESLKQKFINVSEELGFPIQVFIACAVNHFRKPNTIMWDYMIEYHNGGIKPDMKRCFYIGDAAGRSKGWKKGAKKDFSTSDRKFAANIGLSFQTPEEHFLGEDSADDWSWRSLDPSTLDESKDFQERYTKEFQEIVVFCGFPASGKTTFAKRYLEKYTWINRDKLGTQFNCIRKARDALILKKNVIVDNTSPDKETRERYISLGNELCIPIRCFYFNTDISICEHLNLLRMNQTKGECRRVPQVGFNRYKSKFEMPSESEGFYEIITIDFTLKFDSKGDRKFFYMWT